MDMTPKKPHSMDKRFWRALIVISITLGGAWIMASRVPAAGSGFNGQELQSAPREGFLAPDFTLNQAGGGTFALFDQLAEGPVVLVFFQKCG